MYYQDKISAAKRLYMDAPQVSLLFQRVVSQIMIRCPVGFDTPDIQTGGLQSKRKNGIFSAKKIDKISRSIAGRMVL